MGCWNETCGITQMPIEGGDPVRLFLLVENTMRGGRREHVMHYSTDLWKPFGLPLKGTYDEYGRIENIEQDVMSDFLLETIKGMVVECPDRMGSVFKRNDLNWETAIDFLTDEGLKVTDPYHISHITKKLDAILADFKAKFPDLPDYGWSSERSEMADLQKDEVNGDPQIVTMYHMMVHEEVYQSFMRYQVPATRFSSYTDGNLKLELEAGAKEYIAKVREDVSTPVPTDPLELARHMSMMRFSRMDSQNRFVSLTNHLNGNYGSGSYFTKYLDFIEKRIREGASDEDPQIKLLTDQFIQFAMFSQSMTLLRKMWMPQSGKGGQDREYILYKYLAETMRDFSEKKIKAWDEMYGEEENDESTGSDGREGSEEDIDRLDQPPIGEDGK